MPLLNDELTLWEIAFRWNNLDPDNPLYKIYLPIEIKDSFRLVVNEILKANLSSSLLLNKWHSGCGSDPVFFIRHHIDDVYGCIGNTHYKRSFLQFISITRFDFERWCNALNIPLPEFWFPKGWKTGQSYILHDDNVQTDNDDETDEPDEIDNDQKLRTNQRRKLACQEIAQNLWKSDPDMTIANMVKHEAVQNLGGAAHYTSGVVRKWLSAVAPKHVSQRRGRPSGVKN